MACLDLHHAIPKSQAPESGFMFQTEFLEACCRSDQGPRKTSLTTTAKKRGWQPQRYLPRRKDAQGTHSCSAVWPPNLHYSSAGCSGCSFLRCRLCWSAPEKRAASAPKKLAALSPREVCIGRQGVRAALAGGRRAGGGDLGPACAAQTGGGPKPL